MAIPKFYLEKRGNKKENINVFYSYNGQRLQYYSQVRIEPKYFNPKCNDGKASPIKTTAPLALQFNQKLNHIKADILRIHAQYNSNKQLLNNKIFKEELDNIYKPKVENAKQDQTDDFITYFENCIKNSISGERRIKSGKNKGGLYAHNVIKNYKSTLQALKRFVAYKRTKDTSFEFFNSEKFNHDFRNFCYKIENKEVSTFGGFIKDIKTMIKEYGWVPTKSMTIPNYESDTIALTEEQLNDIHNIDLSHQPHLDNARDLFLVGCYTALRYQNYATLKLENIEKDFIRVVQTKTGSRVTIPIMAKFIQILERNNNNLPKSISNQKLNECIKEVCKLAGMTHEIEVKNTKGGLVNIENIPFYKLVSTHTARRTYATILFKKGVPPLLIMSATGHKTESNFLKYIRATNESKAQLLAEMFKKLGL